MEKINRIYIIGGPGSGKTTLAKKLSKQYNLSHIDLDWIRYPKIGQMKSDEEVKKAISQLAKKDKWIMEGIYIHWNKEAFEKADQIVWLDISYSKAFYRISKRYLKNLLKGQDKHGFKNFLKLVKNLKRYYKTDSQTLTSLKDEDTNREKTKKVLEKFADKLVGSEAKK